MYCTLSYPCLLLYCHVLYSTMFQYFTILNSTILYHIPVFTVLSCIITYHAPVLHYTVLCLPTPSTIQSPCLRLQPINSQKPRCLLAASSRDIQIPGGQSASYKSAAWLNCFINNNDSTNLATYETRLVIPARIQPM